MPQQWKLPGPTSTYLVVWSYDPAAKDINRHLPASTVVRAALPKWIRSRRQIVREIYEALGGSQSLGLSSGRATLRDDQLQERLADALYKGRLVVLTAADTATIQNQPTTKKSNPLATTGARFETRNKASEPVKFRVFLPKDPKATKDKPKYKKVDSKEFILLAYMQAFGLKKEEEVKALRVKLERFEGRPNTTELTQGYVDILFDPAVYEEAILSKFGADTKKAKAELDARRKKLTGRPKNEQDLIRERVTRETEQRTGHKPSASKTKSEQRIWESIQDDVLREESKTAGNVATAASGAGAPRVRKIIQSDDFLVLLLDDLHKTKVTVPLNLGGNLKPGTYKLFNANGKLTLPSTGQVPPPSSEWLPPGVSLPAQVDYQVINPWMRLPEIAHRLQANPTVAKAPIGTKFKFWVHMDPELGGKYPHKWKIHQDPITAKQKGVREVIDGPTTPTLEPTATFVGKHRICCELTFVGSNRTSKELLEYLQIVAPEDALLNAAHAKVVAPKYDLFRIDLEMHNISVQKHLHHRLRPVRRLREEDRHGLVSPGRRDQ